MNIINMMEIIILEIINMMEKNMMRQTNMAAVINIW